MFLKILTLLLLSTIATAQEPPTLEGSNLPYQDLYNAENNDSVSCYRIPAIITADNGDVITAIDERVPSCGDLKWSDDINIVMRRSSDDGQTWSEIESIVDFPKGESASDPSMILDRETGEIFLFYNYMNHLVAKDVYYLHMISSTDNGRSWSSPIDITEQITKPEWKNDFKFITSGRGTQTSSGELIHTLVNLERGLHLFKSADHGKSWQLIDTPIQPADESKVIQLSDGSLMINSRVSKLGARYVHTSDDGGASWTSRVDSQLVDPACNASLIRYDDDTLLFLNANSATARENLTIRYSRDEGKTWSEGRSIYSGKAAYSTMTVLSDGRIGILFEKDGYKENVFTSCSIEWITDVNR